MNKFLRHFFRNNIYFVTLHRNPASPFYVPDSIYQNSVYPSYCDSDMVIQHQTLLHRLHETMVKTDQGNFPIERVYIWGILREKLRAGGKMNLILYEDFVNENPIGRLSHQFEFKNPRQCRDDIAWWWPYTKKNLNIENKPGEKNDAIHKGVLWNLPSLETKAMEKTMKLYIYRWGRVS